MRIYIVLPNILRIALTVDTYRKQNQLSLSFEYIDQHQDIMLNLCKN